MKASIYFALAALFVLGALSIGKNALLAMGVRPPVVGSPAPDFQLVDLNGEMQSLNQYRGNVVLLNFWATWCKPCTKEMPAMQRAYDRLRDQGLVVIAINELEDVERVQQHIDTHGHTFQVLLDSDNEVANMYGVVGLPVSIFVDETGHIQQYIKGGLLTEQLIEETVHHMMALTHKHQSETRDS